MADPFKDTRDPLVRSMERGQHQREIDRLKAQLWKYGKHMSTCTIWKSMSQGCNCGWVAVRSTLAPDKQTGDDAFNAAIAPQSDVSGDA